MVTDVIPLLLLVTRLLDSLGLSYAVGGSLASSQYGELRATNDIDLLIDLPAGRVSDFVAAMQPHFDIWEDTVRSAVMEGRSFGSLHIEWHVKVDFFPMSAAILDVQTMTRRQAVRLPAEPTQDIFFASAEDIVLRKLEWYRRSREVLDRQIRDVLGVLKLHGPSMDLAYLRTTAAELDLSSLLERCLDEAGVE